MPLPGPLIALQVVSAEVNHWPASRFLYALYSVNSAAFDYRIDGYRIGSDGTLAYIASTTVPIPVAALPQCLASDPAGRFLYVGMYNGGIPVRYRIGSDGSLTSINSVPGLSRVYAMAVEPTGRFLYALEVGSTAAAFIAQFSIGPDGALTGIAPVLAAGNGYGLFTMDPVGGFLFRPNTIFGPQSAQGNITSFITGANGMLTPALPTAGSSQIVPIATAIDSLGRFLFAQNTLGQTGSIQSYDVSAQGTLTPIGSPLSPVAVTGSLVSDPGGRFLYQVMNDRITGYRVAIDGELSLIGSFATPSTQTQPSFSGNPLAITACHVGPDGTDLCRPDGYKQQRYELLSVLGGNVYRFASATHISDNGSVIGTAGSGGSPAVFRRDSGVIIPHLIDIHAINAAGDVVGTGLDGHPAVSSPPYDSYIDLASVFDWLFGTATAINDRGDIVGRGVFHTIDGTGYAPPFTFDQWFPGLNITSVESINNARQVISSSDPSYLFTPGRGVTTLSAGPVALNNRGDILFFAGDFVSGFQQYVQTISGQTLPLPSGYTWIVLNDRDELVGNSFPSGGAPAYFSPSTGLIDLTTRVVIPETVSQLTVASINNNGEIAVNYADRLNPNVAPYAGVGILEPVLPATPSSGSQIQTSQRSERHAYVLNGRAIPAGAVQSNRVAH